MEGENKLFLKIPFHCDIIPAVLPLVRLITADFTAVYWPQNVI